MNFSFHPEAEEEFNAAIDYYEEIERGFGYDFALEVYSTIQLSIEFTKAWSALEGEVRRALVRRFSYGILYSKSKIEYTCGSNASSSQARLLET